MTQQAAQPQQLYQADQQAVNAMKKHKEQLCSICQQYNNRYVRVTTIDGEVYEGHLSHYDQHHLYLRIAHPQQRFYNPYAAVLPLVLYNLLAITLLY